MGLFLTDYTKPSNEVSEFETANAPSALHQHELGQIFIRQALAENFNTATTQSSEPTMSYFKTRSEDDIDFDKQEVSDATAEQSLVHFSFQFTYDNRSAVPSETSFMETTKTTNSPKTETTIKKLSLRPITSQSTIDTLALDIIKPKSFADVSQKDSSLNYLTALPADTRIASEESATKKHTEILSIEKPSVAATKISKTAISSVSNEISQVNLPRGVTERVLPEGNYNSRSNDKTSAKVFLHSEEISPQTATVNFSSKSSAPSRENDSFADLYGLHVSSTSTEPSVLQMKLLATAEKEPARSGAITTKPDREVKVQATNFVNSSLDSIFSSTLVIGKNVSEPAFSFTSMPSVRTSKEKQMDIAMSTYQSSSTSASVLPTPAKRKTVRKGTIQRMVRTCEKLRDEYSICLVSSATQYYAKSCEEFGLTQAGL